MARGVKNTTPEPSLASLKPAKVGYGITRGEEEEAKHSLQSDKSFLMVRTPKGSVFGKGPDDLITNYAGLVGIDEDEELELYDVKKDRVVGSLVVQSGKARVSMLDKPHKFKAVGAAKLGDEE
jgi:hypothetical protein